MYADKITASMQVAIDETNRRRAKQIAYNTERGIDPQPLRKKIADITDMIIREDADSEEFLATGVIKGSAVVAAGQSLRSVPAKDLADLIEQLSAQMHTAASELQFELAARLRDEVSDLKKELRQMTQAGHA
jgi:excinuclease ABC subunit B